jgi:hypothetical protein
VRAGLLRAANEEGGAANGKRGTANEKRETRKRPDGTRDRSAPSSNEPGHALPTPAVMLLSGANIDPARHAEVVRLGEG